MNGLIQGLSISALLSLYLLLAVSLVKISSERNYSFGSKVMAFVPVLNMILLSKILHTSFWKLFLPIFGLAIIGRIIDVVVLQSFGSYISESEMIMYMITLLITNIPPTWYLWSRVAIEGKHNNPNLLGVLSALPIIGVFTLFYITWRGEW